jgi:fumarate reductase iron-sulfur subunit
MGICGSCGMNVQGEPRLTCGAFLSDFMAKLPRVKPWIIGAEDHSQVEPDVEFLQTPGQLDAYKQFSMCINCMLCYAACPVYGLDPEFIGPAAIALAERYDLDSRDHGTSQRLDVLGAHDGVWACTFVGECTKVCPKHVDPASAIQRYKLKTALHTVKAFLLPRGGR